MQASVVRSKGLMLARKLKALDSRLLGMLGTYNTRAAAVVLCVEASTCVCGLQVTQGGVWAPDPALRGLGFDEI